MDAFERPVALRLPFRFGAATVDAAQQAFVRVIAEDAMGRRETGWAADLMVPKWFDKRPERSQAENVADLRRSVADAATRALGDPALRSPFEHSLAWRAPLDPCNPLLAGFGVSLVERAAIDATCRLLALSFPAALRAGALGFELADGHRLPDRVDVRHTVGLLDALDERPELVPSDGLPVTLVEVIEGYGPRWFKLKLSGHPERDLARLRAIAAVLDARAGAYRTTLDGNEQVESVAAAVAFWEELERDPALARLRAGVAYFEQPLPRDRALDCDVAPLARKVPVVIDESDADDDAFPRARASGYAGVSVKSCKGVFRALLNAERCADGSDCFLTAEDLTAQAGLAVQQDLALAALLGVAHVERNGHHYATGLQGAGDVERERFAAAHPDLYVRTERGARLRIEKGRLAIASLDCVGFATGAHPDPRTMTPLEDPTR